MENLLDKLNESQREAVVYTDGPQLVIAGAGSGKTRVLTFKIAYLLQQGLKPWNILALTFTNKAANEMKARIGNLVGHDGAKHLFMGTFHSIFSRILRVEAPRIGFSSNFTIYDETDSRSLIKTICKEMQLDDKVYKPATVHARISMAKNHFILPDAYAANAELMMRDAREHMSALHKVYAAYMQRCRLANAMDFDDLLVLTYRLFAEHEDVRKEYAGRFQYVLVDEYQDTNHVQQLIVTLLTKEHRRICVVGDDAQSIYGFRGADIDNILDFQQQFPETRLFKLEQNYRSTQNIVKAANSLISHNQRQIKKDVFSENDAGEKLMLKPVYSDKEEALVVCNDIKRIMNDEQGAYSDFAILYRTNSQSRSFEEELRRQSIPYRIYGGLSFYQRKEIKDIIAYFRLVMNVDDEEAFKRIVNYPARGIGNTTLAKVTMAALQNGVSCWEILSNPAHYQLDVNKGTWTKLQKFRDMVNTFVAELATLDAYELGMKIIKESGIQADLYAANDADSLTRQENLQEFVGGLREFVDIRREEGNEGEVFLNDYLQEVSLLSDLDSEGDDESRVVLMTVHSAKGLEFPTVFVVGLEENIFPSPRSTDSPRQLEEERRLLYVAITRAERHCILTCAKNRYRFGRMEFDTPSRFIRDIDPSLLNVQNPMSDFSKPRLERSLLSDELPSARYNGGRNTRETREERFDNPRFLNSRPVASQFMADPIPNPTRPRKPEPAVDPLSEGFKKRLAASGANLKKVSEAISHSSSGSASAEVMYDAGGKEIVEGCVIEHERFGIGTIERLEETGENARMTVNFKHAGSKKLLLKFAKFKVIG
ncbi:ATP-dependent DNA helicase [Prevotella sp. HMSC073D09]|uniref:ATP-dependent helicase n=1 Tax=Prevotella sp. HMSC073D09 TaxID=1739459 RepID=UPI0008A245AB|nr:UvrD-helicase domain-containing protein [Prevotella sp. HMSC073D09]OFQ24418.1 ATP-dependent DNA helicase [Prevotella sp. HMSC073D09]